MKMIPTEMNNFGLFCGVREMKMGEKLGLLWMYAVDGNKKIERKKERVGTRNITSIFPW